MSFRYDAILLLGFKLHSDGTPQEELVLRIDKAAECFHKGLAPIIIPCGGQTPGTPVSEAEVMRRELMARGVPASAIRCEAQSQITVENFRFARQVLSDKRCPRVIVVTSNYHMPRACLICRISGGMRAAGRSARIPFHLNPNAHVKEPLHLIDYMLGYQSGRFKRPKLYLKFMYWLLDKPVKPRIRR